MSALSVAATGALELTLFLARAPDGSGDVCTVAATAFEETRAAAAQALAFFLCAIAPAPPQQPDAAAFSAAGELLVNEAELARAPARAVRSFSPASWQRLEALRERYDAGQLPHSWFA
ncbi:MAG: hypothetical protein EXR73_15185 [Myxococcales bacterium]|nr:hypothetical protein [Myxococcales bacterium]